MDLVEGRGIDIGLSVLQSLLAVSSEVDLPSPQKQILTLGVRGISQGGGFQRTLDTDVRVLRWVTLYLGCFRTHHSRFCAVKHYAEKSERPRDAESVQRTACHTEYT
jgi:hypothetical protein